MNNYSADIRSSNVGCSTAPSSSTSLAHFFDNTSTTISKIPQQQQLKINSTLINCCLANVQTSPSFINSIANSAELTAYLQQNSNNKQLNASSTSTLFDNNVLPLIFQENYQLLNSVLNNNATELQQKFSLSDAFTNTLSQSIDAKQNLILAEQKTGEFFINYFFFAIFKKYIFFKSLKVI